MKNSCHLKLLNLSTDLGITNSVVRSCNVRVFPQPLLGNPVSQASLPVTDIE